MSCIPFGIRKGNLPIKRERTHGLHNTGSAVMEGERPVHPTKEDKIRGATLAREEAKANRALARETAERELAREAVQTALARETAERKLAERAAARAHELEMTRLRVEN